MNRALRTYLMAVAILAIAISAFTVGHAVGYHAKHPCVTLDTVFAYGHTEDSVPSYVNANYDNGVWRLDHCAKGAAE